jgi:hypothetical protein
VNLFDLTEEVAVVLGATGVLGGAIAEGLAVARARVAVLGRNGERGEARVRCIQKKGGHGGIFRGRYPRPKLALCSPRSRLKPLRRSHYSRERRGMKIVGVKKRPIQPHGKVSTHRALARTGNAIIISPAPELTTPRIWARTDD